MMAPQPRGCRLNVGTVETFDTVESSQGCFLLGARLIYQRGKWTIRLLHGQGQL